MKKKSPKRKAVQASPSPVKSKLVPVLKLLFVTGLMYFLIKKGFISVQATQQALLQWQKVLPAVAVMFACTALGVCRWQLLLKAQDIHLTWIRTFQLTMVGNFFNIALPGAVSGDFVKAFYIGKEIKGQRSKAFGSILFDRVAGLSALILVSGGALALGLSTFLHSPLFSAIQMLIELGAACVIAFYAYLFLVKEKRDPLLKCFRLIEEKLPQFGAITRIYESIRNYHAHRTEVLKALALSVLVHLATGWCFLSFAQALGDHHIRLLSAYVVVPLGLLVTAIPIAPAGIGTGNIAFLYFFHLIGSERGADVFSLVALTNITIGALGGLIYFRFKSDESMRDMNPAMIK
jgi:uncharacterized protein (TIRG00374 family)